MSKQDESINFLENINGLYGGNTYLEKNGIGRPSTYASIMKRIQDKGYVNYTKGSLIPTLTGYAVVQFLENYHKELVNLEYTSSMENNLDNISLGKTKKEDFLNNFYFSSNGSIGLKDQLEQECDKSNSCYWYQSAGENLSECRNKCSSRKTLGECEEFYSENQKTISDTIYIYGSSSSYV